LSCSPGQRVSAGLALFGSGVKTGHPSCKSPPSLVTGASEHRSALDRSG
jgi:hypothetical protein